MLAAFYTTSSHFLERDTVLIKRYNIFMVRGGGGWGRGERGLKPLRICMV